jgi:precorrin-2/cobalt-factor-2 C20-methyltransferase
MRAGRLHGLGIGPGDLELLTLNALRLLQASPVVAYLASAAALGTPLTYRNDVWFS